MKSLMIAVSIYGCYQTFDAREYVDTIELDAAQHSMLKFDFEMKALREKTCEYLPRLTKIAIIEDKDGKKDPARLIRIRVTDDSVKGRDGSAFEGYVPAFSIASKPAPMADPLPPISQNLREQRQRIDELHRKRGLTAPYSGHYDLYPHSRFSE